MGLIRMGPPDKLILALKDEFGLNCLVETGTFHADTACWAAEHFHDVVTIERSKPLYERAVSRCRPFPNVKPLLGDTRQELRAIVPSLRTPSVFWLDAHWSGDGTYGEDDQCPLLDEIDAIGQSDVNHFILVDDARLFTSPPQPPHRIEQWPSISAVIGGLSARREQYIVIVEDVIIAVPMMAKACVARHCQEVNARIWESYSRNYQRKLRAKLGPVSQALRSRLKR